MSDEVGSAYVTIRPDLSGFKQELEAGLREDTAGTDQTIKAHLNLDDADALARLEEFKAAADSIKNRAATIKVDDADALLKLATIKEAADRLVERQYHLGVDSSDLESDRLVVAALHEQLDGLATGAEGAGTALDDMAAKADGAGGSLDNLGRSASGAAGSGGAGGGGLGGLVGAALLLGPALVPIGAVAAASIGGIAAMGVQAAAGLGVFALAAKPVITDLNTAATAQQKYSTAVQVSGASSTQARTALVALQTALSQLTPAEQAAAVGFGNFKAAYLSWAQSFDPTILPLLAGGITIAKTAMTEFVPIVASVGKALDGVESSIQAALSSGFATRFLTVFGGQSAAAITTFSNLLIGVGKAAAGLDLAFSPLIDRIEAGLNGLATNLGNFGESAQGSTGIQSFIAYVEKEGPVVGATIEQIGRDFAILAKDLAPLGASYLSGLELIAKAIGVIGTLSPGLVQTAAALLTLGKASQILNSIGPLTAVTSGIKDIASVAAVSGIRNTASGLVTLGVSAGGVIGSLGALGITLGEVAGPAGLAAAALISLTGIMSKGLDQQAGGASQFTKAFIAGLGNVADPVAAVKAEIASLGTQADAVARQIDAIHAPGSGTAIDSAQADELHNNLLPALQDLADKQNNLKAALPGLQSAQDAYTTAQRAAATATAAAATQAQTLTEKLLEAKSPAQGFAIDSQAVALALQSESTDATNLTNSLNVLVGTYLSAQAATLAQKQAVFGFADALKAAHGDITGNSAASITAQQSANSFATTLFGTMIPALAKQGVSAAQATSDVHGQIAAFDAAATSAGLTSAQVQALNKTYGLTPKDVSTAFHDSGYAQVIADAHNAKAAFDDFTGTYVAYLKEEVQVSGTPLSLHNAPGSGYPGNAAGTDFHPGGLSWVGEKGPELLNLPRGSQVVPNGKSMDMARAGLISPPGYADGVGGFDLGYQFGTQVNSGLNTALASDKHPINLGWQSSAQQAFTQPTSAGGPAFQGWQSTAQGNFTSPTAQASAAPSWWQSQFGRGSFARGADWSPTAAGPPALPNFPALTTGDVTKVIADLTAIQKAAKTTSTVVTAEGVSMITSFTKGLKSNADVSESTLKEIAGRLPASIGDAILKAGPLTRSGLLSLYRSLARTTAGSADIQAVANLLPSSIVAELEKAGPLTIAATKSLINKLAGELKTAGGDITKGLAGTPAQLATDVNAAVAVIDKGFKGTTIDKFVDGLGKEFDYLDSKAKVSLASVTKQLTAAQTALASIQKQVAQNASTLEGQFSIIPSATSPAAGASVGGGLNITGVTGTTATNPFTGSTWTAPVTSSNIVAALRQQVADLGKYKAALTTLASWGLSQELLAEFVAAGPAGLPQAQALISGGKATVSLVDSLQAQVDTSTSAISAKAPSATTAAPAPVTSGDIIANLRKSVAALTTYKSVLTKLKGMGLSIEILQQLVAAGPASGLATAQALLAGGKKEVNLADALQGEVDSTSTAIGTLSATATIGGKTVGLAQATGIVAGLKESQTKITDELRLIAKDIKTITNQALDITGGKSGQFEEVGKYIMYGLQQGIHNNTGPVKAEVLSISESMKADIKKALGIKSPSTVFAEIGGNVVQGLAVGISGSQGLANTALDNVWSGLATKSKQKALAFDSTAIPVGLGGSGGGGGGVTYAPTFNTTVTGDVGPATVKLIRSEMDAHDNDVIRTLARF